VARGKQEKQDLRLLGQAIGQIRAERGMSTTDLAAATGISHTLILAIERGRLDPSYERLLALADGLGVRPSAFVIRAEELKTHDRGPCQAPSPD
jgi:transcriptional regulator with XRE-family HTH domain